MMIKFQDVVVGAAPLYYRQMAGRKRQQPPLSATTEAAVEAKFFDPHYYRQALPPAICMYCGLPLVQVKPFSGRKNIGICSWCSNCKTREFFYTPDAAIVADAYRRLNADPERGAALRTLLADEIEEIKVERGMK